MVMDDSSNSIVEKRLELMTSVADKNLKQRIAHFIKPSICLDSIDETSVPNLPSQCLSSLPTSFEPKKWPLEIKFCGWRYQQKNWKNWVVKMASLHESKWKKAGIYEAIMNSTYKIERNNNLLFGVAERWCHETKSFIFSWGEATITLEDVMILGGYSVLGSPVFTPVETDEMEETWEKLNNARKEVNKSSDKKVCHYSWMRKFMNSGSEVEHEAFLALWLSRFVLPSRYDVVVESVLPIAIHLAKGTRIALAPAVLAKLYRDLGWLKQSIVASKQLSDYDDENVAVSITLQAPLPLVLVWMWERFLDLQPKPNWIENGKPRLALWHALKCKVHDVRSVLDSTKERFVWRPYVRRITNCDGARYYGDKAKWILIDSSLDDELLSFARCLRVSELVGPDCIEQYLPHRVALQFGMDQDIPGRVSRSNDSPEIAWSDYNRSVGGEKLYIPPRHSEANVTTRYLDWWEKSMLSLQETSKDVVEELRRSFKITEGMNESDVLTSFKMIPKCLKRPKEDYSGIGFKIMPMKFKGMREGDGIPGSNMNSRKSKRAKECTSASTRPDFYRKSLKRSLQLLKQRERGNNATSDLGSPQKRLNMLAQYPKWKNEVRNAGFVAQSSERKKKDNNASMPHGFPLKSSKGQALGSEVNNEGKNETTPASCKPLKEPPLSFLIQMELNNSPFPPGFPPKGNMLGAKGSLNEEKVTAQVPPGFIPKCNVGNNVDRNYEKSESHRHSLSSDSHGEDQMTVAEMLKSYHKLANVDCRDARENSSGQCQSFSSSIADNELPRCMEPITTPGAEKIIPAEAASGGSKRATIQDAIESNAGRTADKTVGNHGSPDDKAASINDIEGYGNSCLNEISRLCLEARISKLERLVAELKVARKLRLM
ncbi:hypothetical protein REPUB_Repub05bG0034300 [Reevesia pubescens]